MIKHFWKTGGPQAEHASQLGATDTAGFASMPIFDSRAGRLSSGFTDVSLALAAPAVVSPEANYSNLQHAAGHPSGPLLDSAAIAAAFYSLSVRTAPGGECVIRDSI
jgi:hypothetical protein